MGHMPATYKHLFTISSSSPLATWLLQLPACAPICCTALPASSDSSSCPPSPPPLLLVAVLRGASNPSSPSSSSQLPALLPALPPPPPAGPWRARRATSVSARSRARLDPLGRSWRVTKSCRSSSTVLSFSPYCWKEASAAGPASRHARRTSAPSCGKCTGCTAKRPGARWCTLRSTRHSSVMRLIRQLVSASMASCSSVSVAVRSAAPAARTSSGGGRGCGGGRPERGGGEGERWGRGCEV